MTEEQFIMNVIRLHHAQKEAEKLTDLLGCEVDNSDSLIGSLIGSYGDLIITVASNCSIIEAVPDSLYEDFWNLISKNYPDNDTQIKEIKEVYYKLNNRKGVNV